VERDVQSKGGGVGSRRPGFRALVLGIAFVLVGTMALTAAVAISPKLLGQWFTLFEETQDSLTVYKVEARVTNVVPTGVKSGELTVEIRVTNLHPFDVNLTEANFTIFDLSGRRTALVFTLSEGPHLIPRGSSPTESSQVVFTETAKVIQPLGVGNRYLVKGTITWFEVHDQFVIGPLSKEFEEIHSINEFR